MKRNGIIIMVIVLIVILGIIFFLMNSGEETTTDEKQSGDTKTNGVVVASNVVEITSSGFNPKILNVKVGDSVAFMNKDSVEHWPASAMHPTHKVYPGSDIEKCNTAEERNIFDSCRGIAQGGEYKFTFNEKGSWKYHDHLDSRLMGTINVN